MATNENIPEEDSEQNPEEVSEQNPEQVSEQDPENLSEPLSSVEPEEIAKEINPKVGEYWTVKNGKTHFLYSLIVSENPLNVQYFATSVKGQGLRLEDDIWPVFIEDLGRNVSPPTIQQMGRFRKTYQFE